MVRVSIDIPDDIKMDIEETQGRGNVASALLEMILKPEILSILTDKNIEKCKRLWVERMYQLLKEEVSFRGGELTGGLLRDMDMEFRRIMDESKRT